MVLLPALALFTLLSVQDSVKLAPDRTGEPELRKVFKTMGAKRKFVAMVNFSEHERSGDPFIPDRTSTLWYDSPSKFRISNTSVWGDSTLFVSDGKALYFDPLDDSQPAILRATSKELPNAHSSLAMRGNNWSILYYFLMGEQAFDKLVAPEGDIIATKAWGMRQIKFKSKEIGDVTLFYLTDGTLVRADYDNRPSRAARYRTVPQFFDRPEDPLEREMITYEPARFELSTFRAEPPKGRRVIDQRPKGK